MPILQLWDLTKKIEFSVKVGDDKIIFDFGDTFLYLGQLCRILSKVIY